MREETFEKLVQKAKRDRNLPTDFSMSGKMIRKQVTQNNTLVMNRNGSGQVSQLVETKFLFVSVLTQMSRIGDPLTPSRDITLSNNLISGTDYQLCLIEFKGRHYS